MVGTTVTCLKCDLTLVLSRTVPDIISALGFLYRKASIGHFLLIKLSIFCHFLIELKSYFVERAESAVATDTTEMG